MREYVIPGVPVAQGRPRFGNGRVYEPKKSREYKEYIKEVLESYKPELIGSGPISVSIVFEMPMSKYKEGDWHICKPDIDNMTKAILDAANGILWSDDSQVCDLWAAKERSSEPCAKITVVML